jgi:hypothetical protein
MPTLTMLWTDYSVYFFDWSVFVHLKLSHNRDVSYSRYRCQFHPALRTNMRIFSRLLSRFALPFSIHYLQ